MNDYHLPVMTRRIVKSAKPATVNKDAARSRNSLEVAERSGCFRIPTASRSTSSIPATANRVGQRGLSWLTISKSSSLVRAGRTCMNLFAWFCLDLTENYDTFMTLHCFGAIEFFALLR